MNKKILILGANGMIGYSFFKYFKKTNFQTFGMLREKEKLSNYKNIYFDKNIIETDFSNLITFKKLFKEVHPQITINCIGIIKQKPEAKDKKKLIEINALFPHLLKEICAEYGSRLIHISTDCIFSGNKGFYNENDLSDAHDLYGKTKFLGEISNKSTITLRTSVIGYELNSNYQLLNWFLSQETSVRGFSKAIFSGVTTLELAKIIEKFIIPDCSLSGIYHISSESIDKYSLLNIIKKIYKKEIKINKDSENIIDRSLNSSKFRNETGYKPLSWEEAIINLKNFG